MEEEKKKRSKKTAARLRMKKEMEADRKIKELSKTLALQVKKNVEDAPEEEFPLYRDPEEILEEEKFKPSEMTAWEKFREWDGTKSLGSALCAAAAFLFLLICFGRTVSTRGGISFSTALLGLCAVLLCIYGIGFGIAAMRKRERRRAIGRAGLVFNSIVLAVLFSIYIVGVL